MQGGPRFLGVDLGWYGKPSGLASLEREDGALRLRDLTRLEATDEIFAWIEREAGSGTAVVGVDAPLVIRNATGIRAAERELNRDFRRFHAGCHAANLGRPFAGLVTGFSARLKALGFLQDAAMEPRATGRYQIEVHPHAANVALWRLARIVKYKRGKRLERARGLRELRGLLLHGLPLADPPLTVALPAIPRSGNLKPVEDRIDAVVCAYIAAYWWHWARSRNHVYGSTADGFIVVPRPG